MASPTPAGRTGNRVSAAGSFTTDSLRMLSISFLPTRAYTGVTSPSHRLESRGVSRGTGTRTLLTPIWRAYSRMSWP